MNKNSTNTKNSHPPSNQTQFFVFSKDSVADVIEIPILSLTILLALVYTILIFSRPVVRQNKLNWFTVNICISTILLCINVVVMHGNRNDQSSSINCRIRAFFLLSAVNQLMYSHCVAAISRMLAIVYAKKSFSRSNTCLFICITIGWLLAFLLSSLNLFFDSHTCLQWTSVDFISHYTLVTSLIAPIVIVTVCNGRILRHVRQSTRQLRAQGTRAPLAHARDIYLLKVMIITFVVFLVGWTPVFLMQIFGVSVDIPRFLVIILHVLPSAAMLHDTLLLIFTNRPVRLFIKQLVIRRQLKIPVNVVAVFQQKNRNEM
ncbi:unnamed protein product [Adineta ricciae]|uniref:G-protein coupled receptors family 1 profile domain-containing protein n=1 Tax=Adineta ricciae TaxID=249248 RepID=A0A813ZUW0_ADIRI|nr:unnamed protein product [Adineta ricciae]CAF1110822.1 unnamed protein product [Adineta ricciae]